MRPRKRRARLAPVKSIQLFTPGDEPNTSLLDLIDNLLNHGVVLRGELVLGVAGIDLIYLELSALLAAVDRVSKRPPSQPAATRATRRASRRR